MSIYACKDCGERFARTTRHMIFPPCREKNGGMKSPQGAALSISRDKSVLIGKGLIFWVPKSPNLFEISKRGIAYLNESKALP